MYNYYIIESDINDYEKVKDFFFQRTCVFVVLRNKVKKFDVACGLLWLRPNLPRDDHFALTS